MAVMTTCLWFDDQAEQAAEFYLSVFPNSAITGLTRQGPGGHGEPGQVVTVTFDLDGHPFMGLNGGPMFSFSEAISFQIPCADQAEIDRFWAALTADGGQEGRCGWLKDRFGVSWQVIPADIGELLGGEPAAAGRATAAMMTMGKFDVAALRAAREEPAVV
ncbi:VOC family protein [Nakamurella flavida]|uniref:VOC family protein n=1 Tax=Nakamurella flavida TaxID=363630 RepID=A0A938YQ77_9ACTN|nr:VOC family protein [Nakamurella flavida]MBM9477379.1 VOC family protein [Nakamurella flavida]MDP9777311.1 putative 3-demethylubiquinone-9 3-methyltransferase (glyoxalase superfamily) [Nakamurella flavida]